MRTQFHGMINPYVNEVEERRRRLSRVGPTPICAADKHFKPPNDAVADGLDPCDEHAGRIIIIIDD